MSAAKEKGATAANRSPKKRETKTSKPTYVLEADGQNRWGSVGFVTLAHFDKKNGNLGTNPFASKAIVLESLAFAYQLADLLGVWVMPVVDGVVGDKPAPRPAEPNPRADALRGILDMVLAGDGIPRATRGLIEAALRNDEAAKGGAS